MFQSHPRLSIEPRRFRVRLPRTAPDTVFIVRQLKRFEWMTVHRTALPRYEMERLVLRIALLSPDVSVLDSLWAGASSVLASVILRISYIDSDQSAESMHQWAEAQFDSPDLRLELIAAATLNGVGLERLWCMPPEEWYLHIHAGLHAATLSGAPVAEYVQGGIKAVVEAIRKLQQMQMASGAPIPPRQSAPGTVEEYSFQWRKGSEPIIRGSVR